MIDIAIRLAYAIMIVGIILCFVFSKNHQRDLRKAANEFAFAFVKLSNLVSPKPPKEGLLVEKLPGGKVRVLPAEEQPKAIQSILERANSQKAVELFAELDAAADLVCKRASMNRTQKAQFMEPIDQLLLLVHTFLVGCEDLGSIDTMEKKTAFDSFLMEQPVHRMVLIKRITGDKAGEYRELNRRYAKEMEQIEAEEAEARRKGKKAVGKAAREEQAPPPAPREEKEPEHAPEAAEPSAPGADEEAAGEDVSIRDKWGGWGCG